MSANRNPLKSLDSAASVIGNWKIGMHLSQERTIEISGLISSQDDPATVNERLDWAQDSLDRQFIRTDIVNKEAQLAAAGNSLDIHRQHFEVVVQKKTAKERGEKIHLTTQDKQLIDKYDSDVKAVNAQIQSLQAAIAKGKSRLNGQSAT